MNFHLNFILTDNINSVSGQLAKGFGLLFVLYLCLHVQNRKKKSLRGILKVDNSHRLRFSLCCLTFSFYWEIIPYEAL